jgi:phospholipase C
MRLAGVGLIVVAAWACGNSSSTGQALGDGGADGGLDGVAPQDGSSSGASSGASDASDASAAMTKVQHVVVLIQENHTFDNYFGQWCTAATGSNPTCTQGASCCEAAPAKDPSGSKAVTLNDTLNGTHDPNHTQACEVSEVDGGKMDAYVTASCGSAQNVAYADATTAQAYWTLAQQGALADHYFQPALGESDENNMYFARTQFVFLDNTVAPQGAIGSTCQINSNTKQYTDTTIADLLEKAGVGWAWYSEGYSAMAQAVQHGACPTSGPSDCAFGGGTLDCGYDPTDNPFAYYKDLVDDPAHFKDYSALATDLSGGTLPPVVFVKPLLYKSEHPGYQNKISAGIAFVQSTLQAIAGSSYAPSTLVLFTYDESGGWFDHVPPPPTSTVDNQAYGPRVPMIAIGPFARSGTISHVVMEHSSVVKFIEYNWLGGKTGQLGGRDGDAKVANIGSLLDPTLGVPEN